MDESPAASDPSATKTKNAPILRMVVSWLRNAPSRPKGDGERGGPGRDYV
jgi:hypothetical protein